MKKNIKDLKRLIKGPVFSIHTPFKKNGEIDYISLKKYLEFLYKRGARVFYVDDEPENGIDRYEYTSGWEHYDDRKPKFINFVKEWDDWDKILLRNSKARIKKLFKGYYNSRDWQTTDDDFDAARILVKNLKANLSLPAGAGLLSWWHRSRLLRTSPFNADGKLCTKKD